MSPTKSLARFLSETPQEMGKFQIELCTTFPQQCKEQREANPLRQPLAFERQRCEQLPRNLVYYVQFGRFHYSVPCFDSTTRGLSGLNTVIFPFARNRQPNVGWSLEIPSRTIRSRRRPKYSSASSGVIMYSNI